MVHIEDATNITLPLDEFKPSSQELKEVLSKCLSYYGLSLDKIDPEIFNVDDVFYVLSKNGDQYVVLFYHWIDRSPVFLTVENDEVIAWTESQIVDFVLNFANLHPGKCLTSYDYQNHCSLTNMETIAQMYHSPMSRFLDDTLLTDERNRQYRANMQAFLRCMYNYDFLANITAENELFIAEEFSHCGVEDSTFAHYEQ